MEFKKCKRCGNFYNTELEVCQECKPKENLDVEKLKNYIDQYGLVGSIQDISIATGINTKNLNRYLGKQEFSGIINGNGIQGQIGEIGVNDTIEGTGGVGEYEN